MQHFLKAHRSAAARTSASRTVEATPRLVVTNSLTTVSIAELGGRREVIPADSPYTLYSAGTKPSAGAKGESCTSQKGKYLLRKLRNGEMLIRGQWRRSFGNEMQDVSEEIYMSTLR